MKIRRLRKLLIIAVLCVLFGAGLVGYSILKVTTYEIKTDQLGEPLLTFNEIPQEQWAKLAQKKIFFAHKNLGDEIIDGIHQILEEHPFLMLSIEETTDPAAFEKPVFAHAEIGRCLYPESKMIGFKNVLDADVGEKVDIAILKFCYADVIWQTDAQEVFQAYCQTMKELKAEFPHIQFLHVTVPIGSKPQSKYSIFREAIKSLVRRPSCFDDNLRRRQYNAMLRETFSQDYIFDLALIESINSNGLSCYSKVRDVEKVLIKAPEYSIGNSHLTVEGRKKVAEQLLVTLAKMANTK